DYLFWDFQVITNSVLIRRDFLKDKTLFVEFLSRGQENEFFSRLFYKFEKEYRIEKKPLFLYRQHEETKSNKHKLYVKAYKTSLIYTYSENLKRAIALKDSKLATFFYYALIRIYFDTFKYDDRKNKIKLTKNLAQMLLTNLIHLDVVILIIGMTVFNLNSYKLYQFVS